MPLGTPAIAKSDSVHYCAASETQGTAVMAGQGGSGLTPNGFQGDDAYRAWQEQRAHRVKKNEEGFRAYNERRAAFEHDVLPDDEITPFVCECGDQECHRPMELTIAEFERSHARPNFFAVDPGHVLPEFEEVMEEHDRYWVIRKFGEEEMAQRVVAEGA